MEMGKSTKTNKKATPKTTAKNTSKENKKSDTVKKTQTTKTTKNNNKKNNVKKETPKTKVETKKENVKETKIDKREIKPKIKEEKSDLKKLLILIVIIVVIFLIFYFAVTFINNKKLKNIFPKDDALGSTEIDYTKVMVGNMLKQNQEEYYVLAVKTSDDETNPYENTLSEYANYQAVHKIYTIDLNDVFNSKYVKDESDFEDDIIFSQTTLVKVNNGEIDEVYEDADEIEEELQDLLEEAKENTK